MTIAFDFQAQPRIATVDLTASGSPVHADAITIPLTTGGFPLAAGMACIVEVQAIGVRDDDVGLWGTYKCIIGTSGGVPQINGTSAGPQNYGHADVVINGSGDAVARWWNDDYGTALVHHVSVRVDVRWAG